MSLATFVVAHPSHITTLQKSQHPISSYLEPNQD
jgi:hypothetical protein